MNPALLACLVLLATFALAGLALSGLVALLWRVGLGRTGAAALDLVSLRLLPAAGALLIALTVALPAFLRYEPHREHEAAGPLLIALAALAGMCLIRGMWRGWRACGEARALLEGCRLHRRHDAGAGPTVHMVDIPEPLVAVIGVWRPRIVAAESVRAACSGDEFREVLAHEAAHLATRDNLKLLLLLCAPDVLAWTPLAATLMARWRAAAECEADQRATGRDSERRLALASALIKVARLLNRVDAPRPALAMPVAADDVPDRVRRLLAPPARAVRARILLALAGCAVLVPLLALPRYALLHELIERLVDFGR